MFKWFTIFILAASSGCTAVHDLSNKLPVEARGTLKGSDPIRVTSIGAQSGPNRLGFGSDWDGSYTIYLVPGPVNVTVSYHDQPFELALVDAYAGASADRLAMSYGRGPVQTPNHYLESRGSQTFAIDVRAGHTYTLTGARDGYKTWKVLMKDSYQGNDSTNTVARGNLALSSR